MRKRHCLAGTICRPCFPERSSCGEKEQPKSPPQGLRPRSAKSEDPSPQSGQKPRGLYDQTRRIVFLLAIAGTLVSLLVGGLHAYLRGDWLDAVLAGIAIGMSMLPEGFRGPRHLHGHGRMEAVPGPRPDTPRSSDRNAGGCDHTLH